MNRISTKRNTSQKITKTTTVLAITIGAITLLLIVVLSPIGQIPQQQAAAQTQKPHQQIVQHSTNMTTAKMPNTAGTMDTTTMATMGGMTNMMNAMNPMMEGMHMMMMMNAMNMPMTSNNMTTSMSMDNAMQ